MPASVRFTTWTLRYNRMDWLTVDGLEHHWRQARVAGTRGDDGFTLKTENVTALTAGGFRHGAQEIVEEGLRFGLWIDPKLRREEDLAMARDLRKLGARVMAIGQDLPEDAGDLVFNLPAVPAAWQFVTDIVPAQLAAEHLAGLRGVDCDNFRLGSHVVTKEGGLL